MRRVLITGIAGFTGSHLAERLFGHAELWGVHVDDRFDNIAGLLTGPGKINLVKCDLTDAKAVGELVDDVRPEEIYHLAAQSSPSLSNSMPVDTFRVNVFSTLNIFEAVLKSCPGTKVLNVGSGDEYGSAAPGELPVKETAELRPLNPYAVSKVAQDLLGFQYNCTRGLKVIRCRPFNHFGPRQSDAFVAASFARQIAEIEAGVSPDKVMRVGNLDATRDFLYVSDVVDAYTLLMEKGEHGTPYNISSGASVKIGTVLNTLLSLSQEDIRVQTDPARLRKKETPGVYGDASRLKALGWSQRYTLADGLRELLDYWRARVRSGSVKG